MVKWVSEKGDNRQIIHLFIIETMQLIRSHRERIFKVKRVRGQGWKETFME